jgi:hypothetical protein
LGYKCSASGRGAHGCADTNLRRLFGTARWENPHPVHMTQ